MSISTCAFCFLQEVPTHVEAILTIASLCIQVRKAAQLWFSGETSTLDLQDSCCNPLHPCLVICCCFSGKRSLSQSFVEILSDRVSAETPTSGTYLLRLG